jgi:predicted transcriptional regulator
VCSDDNVRTHVFFALSDVTRRGIISRTLERPRSVSDFGRLYPISSTAVQKHVDVLLSTTEKVGA